MFNRIRRRFNPDLHADHDNPGDEEMVKLITHGNADADSDAESDDSDSDFPAKTHTRVYNFDELNKRIPLRSRTLRGDRLLLHQHGITLVRFDTAGATFDLALHAHMPFSLPPMQIQVARQKYTTLDDNHPNGGAGMCFVPHGASTDTTDIPLVCPYAAASDYGWSSRYQHVQDILTVHPSTFDENVLHRGTDGAHGHAQSVYYDASMLSRYIRANHPDHHVSTDADAMDDIHLLLMSIGCPGISNRHGLPLGLTVSQETASYIVGTTSTPYVDDVTISITAWDPRARSTEPVTLPRPVSVALEFTTANVAYALDANKPPSAATMTSPSPSSSSMSLLKLTADESTLAGGSSPDDTVDALALEQLA